MLIECERHPDAELLIVEGKNAANALSQVRRRQDQAVLALQGKIPNAAKTKSVAKLLQNVPILNLLEALGSSLPRDFNLQEIAYKKVIIFTDPDADGIHTRVLVTLLFYQHLRTVIEQGRLYAGYAPLYSVASSKLTKEALAFSQTHYTKMMADFEEKGIIDTETTRYKGLAGMARPLLSRCCTNRESRVIKSISVADGAHLLKMFG